MIWRYKKIEISSTFIIRQKIVLLKDKLSKDGDPRQVKSPRFFLLSQKYLELGILCYTKSKDIESTWTN